MNNNFYKTRDLAESAALIVSGQRLVIIERVGKTCIFVFANAEVCSQVSYKYFFGNLQVNARGYYEAITRLKNRIFAKI